MRVSTNWLRDYVDIDVPSEKVANDMLSVGNEYSSVNRISDSDNLVVGLVLEKDKHPQSDHLSVLKVDLKDNVYTIVCGAPNVDINQKVIVARMGAKLPNMSIEKTEIRGIESCGMVCSLAELGIESKYLKEEDKKGIHVLGDDAVVGDDALKYLNYDDVVIEYDLTANRSDLLSMIGMAYEVGAIYNKKVEYPKINIKEVKEKTKDLVNIKSNTDNCSAYLSRIVKDVVIKESPLFIKARLMAAGIRPINNVVDISNYVMIEYGQPLHFFDYDKIDKNIVIRMANENEEITTLDGIKRVMNIDDILIATDKEPIAIAGVMGGLSSEVEDSTKNILIEAASFNKLNIRNTSKRILRSESSARFEKGIDPAVIDKALDRAAYLLQEYASGKVLRGIAGFNNLNSDDKTIYVELDNINKLLGMKLNEKDVKEVFSKLKFDYDESKGRFKVLVPSRRLDISIKEDLIEEVGRIHGYDNMIGTLPITITKKGEYSSKYLYIKKINNKLRSLGLSEVITYSLTNKDNVKKFTNDDFEQIELSSYLSEDRKVLRYSLIPSLLETIDYNLSRKNKDIMIYEVGKSFYKEDTYKEVSKLCIGITGNYINNNWKHDEVKCDFYLLKGMLDNLFNYLDLKYALDNDCDFPKQFHPGKTSKILLDNEFIGYIGCVNPSINKNEVYVLEIDLDKMYSKKIHNIKYKDIPKYPSIVKDMAFLFDKSIKSIDVIKLINEVGGEVVKDVDVFDLYVGDRIEESKKSIAFSITFNDINKTLKDDEVLIIFNNIIKEVECKFNAQLRNK